MQMAREIFQNFSNIVTVIYVAEYVSKLRVTAF